MFCGFLCICLYLQYLVVKRQNRCDCVTSGTILNSDFTYIVDGQLYRKALRPYSKQYGVVRVHYNSCNIEDAYVIGDWADVRFLHHVLQVIGVICLLLGCYFAF